jgi:basic amino acid/polyamine antiporter, APA family
VKTPADAPQAVRRRLGSPVLFGLVQSFIAAALYFSLGVAADRAGGWTWVVYLAAAVFFVITALSYVEGASLHQERGGATVMARYAFNELWSFVAGWAILLDCVLLIALTSFITTDYLAVFWKPLGEGGSEFFFGAVLVLAIAVINVRGLDPLKFGRIAWLGIVDLGVQVLLLVAGLALLYDPSILTSPASFGGGGVGLEDGLFAFTLAIVACTGLDSSAGFAGQVAIGRKGLRRLLVARSLAVFVPYFGLMIVALSTLGAPDGLLAEGTGRQDLDAPLLGVTAAFEDALLRDVASYAIALSAAAVCFATCAAAMLGLSRIGYSLALNRQIPSRIGQLHPRFATPVVVIAIGTLLALILLSTGDVEFLLGTYAFGATIAFTLVHLAVLRMRRTEPDRDRPYRIPLNVRIGGTSWPVLAVLGALASLGSLAAVLWLHPESRVVGPLWMAFGLTLYVSYRLSQDKSLTKRVAVPERTLTRAKGPEAAYRSILVPILGTPLDDDIVQTAGRLVAEEDVDEDERDHAQIEAMWVFAVPMALPLDGRLPEGELKRSRAALARAKAVGEEYEGVEVATFSVRARSAGEAIVREARRRGVEAIVMPAEEPTRIRGGVLLGGQRGLRDTFVGETTRYVVNKAHCRVILTAPPASEHGGVGDIPLGHRTPRKS